MGEWRPLACHDEGRELRPDHGLLFRLTRRSQSLRVRKPGVLTFSRDADAFGNSRLSASLEKGEFAVPRTPQVVMNDTLGMLKVSHALRRDLMLGLPSRAEPHDGHCQDDTEKGPANGRKGLIPLWDVGRALERKCSHYTKANHSKGSLRGKSVGILTVSLVASLYDPEGEGEDQRYCAQFCPGRSSSTHQMHTPETPTTESAEERRGNAKRNDTHQTSNCLCPLANVNGRISPENYPKRLKRLKNGSASTLEVWAGTLLLMVAMVVGSCDALPTHQPRPLSHAARALPTHQTRPLSSQPFRRDWRMCCGRPDNVTVLRTTPTSVLVTWNRPTIQPLKYEITYKPTDAKYRVVAEVVAPQRSVVLERLLPLTQYQVYVTTVVNSTMVWTSPIVTFHTATDDAWHGNMSGHLFSTPTMLDNVEVSVSGIGGTHHKVGLVRVRAEEVGIVLLVLAVWMFAIALFFNRWGKIRMLEPYQEPYKEAPPQLLQHRPSCPMADPCAALPINAHKNEYLGIRRPRQNSVFVGRTRSHSLEVHPPRRVKSALNLTTLVLQESEEEEGAMATTLT